MYKEIECETPDGKVSKQTFKVHTGANGNLMPITMVTKLFPKISLKTLEKMIESDVNLYAYIKSLARSLAATASTNIIATAIDFV